MKENESRFMTWLGLAGVTVLLSAFFLTLFGIVDLSYVNNIKISNLFNFIGNTFLYLINLFLFFNIAICSNLKDTIKKALAATILYVCLYFILIYTCAHIYVLTFFFPILSVFLFSGFNLKCVKKFIIFCLFSIPINLIFSFIKIKGFDLSYNYCNFITTFVMSIDSYLFFIYYKEVIRRNGMVANTWKCLVLSKSKSIRQSKEPSEEVLNVEELTKRQERIFLLLASGYQIFQLLVVLGIGMINNMILELIIMLVVFWNGRKILGNCWHSEKLSMCSIATFSGFYILTKVTPPLSISLFLVIALCGVFTYFMYLLGNKADRLDELEHKYETDFTKYGLTKEMADFAYDYKVDGISLKEQSDKTGLPIATVKKYRTRVNNAIKNN